MYTVLELVFSTNRLEYLTTTLQSARKMLDWTGVKRKFLLIDDYPDTRNDGTFTSTLIREVGADLFIGSLSDTDPMVYLNSTNLGITGTWAKAFSLVRAYNQTFFQPIDYILHHEDDVALNEPVSVAHLIEQHKQNSRLSQIALRRGSWYPNEERRVEYPVWEESSKYFWSLYSLYPSWIANIDWKGVTGHNPSESVIATYLSRTQGLGTGIYAPNGKPVVEHLGEYSQGQRAARGEPGWERFKTLPQGKYCSKTGRALR